MNWSHQRQICIKVIKCCVDTRVSLIFPRSLSFKIGIVFSCAVICEFCSLVWQTRLVAYRFFRVTSKANLPKSHQMLRGHARKFDFSSFALFQNWYSFLLCSDLWILLLGLTNKTCSLQVFRVTLTEIKASDEWRKIEYSCFLAVIYRFWNSFQTSEATTTRFFTAHQNVSGKHCQIAFYCRVTNKSSQTNHSCLRAERVYSVHERQTRMTRNNPWTTDYRPKLFLLTHRKFVFN